MAKACVLLTFEGAGQTSIECLDSRIAFLRREFPPPMRRADAAAKGIGSISEPFRKEVESVESVVIPVAVYRAQRKCRAFLAGLGPIAGQTEYASARHGQLV
jgi:hypothetical protein